MPSSRGDARAAERARLPGVVFLTPVGDCVLRCEFEGLRSRESSTLERHRAGLYELQGLVEPQLPSGLRGPPQEPQPSSIPTAGKYHPGLLLVVQDRAGTRSTQRRRMHVTR
jgi:hypothetical protein